MVDDRHFSERRRVLVVDDEPDLVRGLTLRFQTAGFDVLTAQDGAQGALIAARQQPDIIILDIGLPGVDGHEMARRLQSDEKTMGIPILFLTAKTTADDFRKAELARAAGYVTKPFRANELLRKVELVLGAA